MNIPTVNQHQHIQMKYSFGLNSKLRNGLFFYDENRILYPSGYQIVSQNINEKLRSQNFFNGPEQFLSISCIQLSPLKRYLGLGVRGVDRPAIIIYDTVTFKRKKTLKLNDEPNIKEFVAIQFSIGAESKNIVTLTGGEGESVLSYWQYDKSKCLASIKISQIQIDLIELGINPFDVSFMSILGNKTFKCYKIVQSQEDNKQQFQLKNVHQQLNSQNELPQTYSGHCWLTIIQQVVVASEFGQLMVLNNECDFMYSMENSPKSINKQNWRVNVIQAYSKGFIVGGQSLQIYIYRYDGDQQLYEMTNTLNIKQNEQFRDIQIQCMAISPDKEDRILVTLNNNCIMGSKFKVEYNKFEQECQFEQVSLSNHVGQIYDMDICVRKPLIVTCGSDKYIKVWNFIENTLEISHPFTEESYGVSIHPSGHNIVVGFSDRLKIMNLIVHNNQIKPIKEIQLKQIKEVQYSNGGQYFAAASGSAINSTMPIFIYSSYTGENVNGWQIKAHIGRVKNIKWTRDDRMIISCGADGMIYGWKIQDELQKVHSLTVKQVIFQSVAITNEITLYAVGSDKTIREIKESSQTFNNDQKRDLGVNINQLVFPSTNKILFCGVQDEQKSSGEVRCYKFPLNNNQYSQYQSHENGGIEKMKVSFDDQYLVTCGKDGVVNVFDVKDKEIKNIKSKDKDGYSDYDQQILITRNDIEDIKQTIEMLKQQQKDSNIQNNMLKLSNKEDQIQRLEDNFKNMQQTEFKKYKNYQNQKAETERKFKEEIRMLLENQELEMQELDTTYQKKVMQEVANYEEAKRQQELKNQEYESNKQNMIDEHKKNYNKEEQQLYYKLEKYRTMRQRKAKENVRQQSKNKDTLEQIEQETQQEIQNIKVENTKEIMDITDIGLKAKSDVKITDKKIHQQQLDLAENKEKTNEALLQLQQIKDANINLKAENEIYANKINEKDKLIEEKERKIHELKKRQQELEKFKFVLDHRIKELKRDIGPREDNIQKMRVQTNNMDKQLKKFNSINNTLGAVIDQLDQTRTDMSKKNSQLSQQIQLQNTKVKQFKNELYQAVQHILDFPALQAAANALCKTYLKKDIKPVEIDPDIMAEYEHQKKHLEICLAMYAKNLQKDNEIHKTDNNRIMKENVDLIRAIQQYRNQINEKKVKKKAIGEHRDDQQLQEKRKILCNSYLNIQAEQQNKIEKLKIQLQEIEEASIS